MKPAAIIQDSDKGPTIKDTKDVSLRFGTPNKEDISLYAA